MAGFLLPVHYRKGEEMLLQCIQECSGLSLDFCAKFEDYWVHVTPCSMQWEVPVLLPLQYLSYLWMDFDKLCIIVKEILSFFLWCIDCQYWSVHYCDIVKEKTGISHCIALYYNYACWAEVMFKLSKGILLMQARLPQLWGVCQKVNYESLQNTLMKTHTVQLWIPWKWPVQHGENLSDVSLFSPEPLIVTAPLYSQKPALSEHWHFSLFIFCFSIGFLYFLLNLIEFLCTSCACR